MSGYRSGWLAGAVLAILAAAAPVPEARADVTASALAGDAAATYESAITDWRERRHERLASDNGWLTLVGLEWLREGVNRVGSAADADVRVPGGPADWGTIRVDGQNLLYRPSTLTGLTVDGEPAAATRLVPDSEGEPTVVAFGDINFHVIFRESWALRIKHRKAPALLAFGGVDTYAIDPEWRIEARFIPAEPGTTVEIGDVLGHLKPMPVSGFVEFERDGRLHRMLGLMEEDLESVWFLFADRTSGRETYGAGRFLYSDGMPMNGRLVIDFNKAYNPPCAFNDYSTCPLPPQQNRLDLAITAGEKKYSHH
jgi:uncharacterized protein (DUF1684 family)